MVNPANIPRSNFVGEDISIYNHPYLKPLDRCKHKDQLFGQEIQEVTPELDVINLKWVLVRT